MSTKFTITIALTAGLIGGFISRYSGPAPVYAQAPASPQEIRAQKFVLVGADGKARGVFGIETNGTPQVELTDTHGRVFALLCSKWGFGPYQALRRPKEPTLLPVKP